MPIHFTGWIRSSVKWVFCCCVAVDDDDERRRVWGVQIQSSVNLQNDKMLAHWLNKRNG